MKKLFALLLLCVLSAPAQVAKKYPSLLWKITGNGLKKPSYLYGTMHVSHRAAYHLSDQFFNALKDCETVGLETDPGLWLENMEATGELSEISHLRETASSRDFYRQAFPFVFPDKRVLQSIIGYDPDIINGLLYRHDPSRENFEESTYIDLFIYQSASKLGKPVISLEDFMQSEIRARLSALPDEAETKTAQGDSRSQEQIEDAYRQGDLDRLDSLSRLNSTANLQHYLIDERNASFVATIDSVIRKHTLFSGVGAAHLPGDKGMIELLRSRGYTVEAVLPSFSRKSNDKVAQLDKMKKRSKFSQQFADDSLFSAELPGRLYPLVDLGYLNYHIHPDMVNGTFYTVVRLRHLSPLYGLSADRIRSRVDSLLFEAVPGRILRKRDITDNGIPGIEVVNRTRSGDEQRYRFYFTPAELVMFKLGGNGSYATGAESERFFSSIHFHAKPSTRTAFAPPAGGFSVTLPATPSYVKHPGAVMSGAVEDLFAYDASASKSYGVRRAIYNDFDYLEEDTFELNQISKHVLSALSATQQVKRETTRELELPCMRFSGVAPNGDSFLAKLYLRGPHYYLVYEKGTSVSFDDPFFKTFAVTPFRYLHPLKEVTDPDMYFKAVDEVTDDALSRFNEKYKEAYALSRTVKDTIAKEDFAYRSAQKRYYSPSTNEFVNIQFEKYNDYDYRDSTEIVKKIENAFRRSSSMMVSLRGATVAPARRDYRFLLTDTATVRGIDVKVIFNNGVMYELDVPCDTARGPEGWAGGFFTSFHPADTVIGVDIFRNKFGALLNDLVSADTLKRRRANASLREGINMRPSFAGDFARFVASPRFAEVSEDGRAQLLVNGGTLNDDRIIAPYTSLYKAYRDSFFMQLCVLKGLGCSKTVAAREAFAKLMAEDPPLVGDESAINDVFNVLKDSLELCRTLFPSMLSLTKYEEYRNPVYSLLAMLVHNDVVKPSAYESRRAGIISDAELALKRYNPSVRAVESDGQFEHLEKTARELAENIKGNLDGLANNNFYGGSSFLKNLDATTRHPLVNYAFILSPFYKSDPAVRQFISKLSKLKTQSIAMPVTINLLKQNVVVNDTLVPYYSRNKFTRAFFYSELEKEKLADRFDKKYLSQNSLNESVLSSQKQLYAFYAEDGEKNKKDSVALLKEIDASNKYQRGKIYIYRNVKARPDEEQWSVIFVESRGKEVNSRIEVIAPAYQVNRARSEKENIEDLLARFYLSYRKRGLVSNEAYD